MAGKWPYRRVEEIALKVAMGPFGSSIKVETFTDSGIPIISGQHLRGAQVTDGDFNFITEAHADSLKNANVQRGDVIFTHAGNIGQVAFIPEDSAYQRYVISQRQFYLRCNTDLVLPEFVTYYFKTAEGQHRLLANANQVGVPSIARPSSYLKTIEIPVPSLDEQLVVVRNIRALDAKIRLNSGINQTLESMAQAIFKSWFVDFDPVKAKIAAIQQGRDPLRAAMTAISGKSDAELDALPPEQYEQLAATAALFPEEMEESELGEIPRGWEASQVGKITSRVSMGPFGSDIKKENFVEAGVPVIRGGNLTDGLVERNYVFISESKANELKNANAFPGDIVITHRGTLGQVGLIPRRSKFPRYVVSQSQMLLSVNIEQMSPRYLFEFLRSENGKRLLLANTSQVGVPAIARPTGSVKTIPLVVPDKTVLDAYDKVLDPFLTELSQMVKSSETLAELREALLPRLISGELSVNSLTKAAGAT